MVCFEEIISGEIISNGSTCFSTDFNVRTVTICQEHGCRIIYQNEKVGEHKKTGLGILQQSGV